MTKKKDRKGLTIRQKKFTKEYIACGNGTEAAIKAGYSRNSAKEIASQNLTKPAVRQEIQSAAAKLGLDAEYVLSGIKEIHEFNKQKRIKAKRIGDETFHEEEMIDAHASLKAGDLLGKHLKLFTDQIDLKGNIETKTDEEQEKAIAKRAALLLMKNSLDNE